MSAETLHDQERSDVRQRQYTDSRPQRLQGWRSRGTETYLGPTPCLATHYLFSNRTNEWCRLLFTLASKKEERHQTSTQRLGLCLGWTSVEAEGQKGPARGGQAVLYRTAALDREAVWMSGSGMRCPQS